MKPERIAELEDISRRSALSSATHRHWFPNVYADELIREIQLVREENEKLHEENEKLRSELNWYQVEAVARTNTDGRTEP